jgi:hypothetical protein
MHAIGGIILLLVAANGTDEICFEGNVVDRYCIDRGSLLDNPSVSPLEKPNLHSIHCLVDVPACVKSGYDVLVDPVDGSTTYCRAFALDAAGTEMIAAQARKTGSKVQGCTTCTNISVNAQKAGFRSTVFGTVVPNSGSPPKLQLTRVEAAGCGCPNGTYTPTNVNCDSGKSQPYMVAHGVLMLLGWGLMLPSGVISARLLKHRPNALWFRLHRILQPVGLVLAIVGWSIALYHFKVFEYGSPGLSWVHAVLGSFTMVLGLLQPINAFVRPHNVPNVYSSKRQAWEILHKSSGYIAVSCGILNVALGTTRTGIFITHFMGAFLVALILLCSFGGGACYEMRQSERAKKDESSSVNAHRKHSHDDAEEMMASHSDVC